MKITLLCGSLEPGRDGVGDYSRCLAKAATHLGHDLQLISLKDSTLGTDDGAGLRVIRRNGQFNDPTYLSQIQSDINEWAPDILSLQFVPFAYHPKGLIHDLIPFIQKVRSGLQMHLMFHETWLRWEYGTSLKHRLIGQIQRQKILQSIRLWQPETVHTSNPYYAQILRHNGIPCNLLPLFGNIPIAPHLHRDRFEALLQAPLQSNERRILFPFNQDAKWRPLDLLQRIQATLQASQSTLPIRLIQIGRTHSELEHWKQISEFAAKADWKCDVLGAQDAETLSIAFQSCQLGISSSPIQLAGKSGAVAAMREHGLPVLCSSPSGLKNWKHYHQARLAAFEINDTDLHRILVEEEPLPPNAKLASICQQWLDDIRPN